MGCVTFSNIRMVALDDRPHLICVSLSFIIGTAVVDDDMFDFFLGMAGLQLTMGRTVTIELEVLDVSMGMVAVPSLNIRPALEMEI